MVITVARTIERQFMPSRLFNIRLGRFFATSGAVTQRGQNWTVVQDWNLGK